MSFVGVSYRCVVSVFAVVYLASFPGAAARNFIHVPKTTNALTAWERGYDLIVVLSELGSFLPEYYSLTGN